MEPTSPNALPHIHVEFNPETGEMPFRIAGTMPCDRLIGTLELIKSLVLDEQKRQMAMQQQQDRAKSLIVPNVNGVNRLRI